MYCQDFMKLTAVYVAINHNWGPQLTVTPSVYDEI